MHSCLWVQWKKPTDSSRFVIDGISSLYTGTVEQNEIMELLVKVPKFKEICKKQEGDNHSSSFRLSIGKVFDKTYCCVEGNFEETDEANRKLVYILLTQQKDSSQIADILKDYSSKLGVTPLQQDLEAIRNHQFKTINYKKLALCVTTTTITLLLLFMLLNHLSKQ